MENAMNEEKIQDLNRRNGISHHKKRLHFNARSGNGANGNGDEYLEEDGLVEGIQKETLNERAVSVLARVHEKLTGRDRIAYKIGSKRRTSHSGSSSESSGSGSGSGSDNTIHHLSSDSDGWASVQRLLDELPSNEEVEKETGVLINTERAMTIYTWGDRLMNRESVPGVHHFNAKILEGRGGGANTKYNATQEWRIVRNVIQSMGRGAGRRWLMGCLRTIETKAAAYDESKKDDNDNRGLEFSVFCSQGRHRSVSAALILHWKYYRKALVNHLTIR